MGPQILGMQISKNFHLLLFQWKLRPYIFACNEFFKIMVLKKAQKYYLTDFNVLMTPLGGSLCYHPIIFSPSFFFKRNYLMLYMQKNNNFTKTLSY